MQEHRRIGLARTSNEAETGTHKGELPGNRKPEGRAAHTCPPHGWACELFTRLKGLPDSARKTGPRHPWTAAIDDTDDSVEQAESCGFGPMGSYNLMLCRSSGTHDEDLLAVIGSAAPPIQTIFGKDFLSSKGLSTPAASRL